VNELPLPLSFAVAVLENDTLHQAFLPWPVRLELPLRAAELRSFLEGSRNAGKYSPVLPPLARRRRETTSGLEEGQQVGVELVLVRVREAVGCARVDPQGRILDHLR
jgi:hypothetical protein